MVLLHHALNKFEQVWTSFQKKWCNSFTRSHQFWNKQAQPRPVQPPGQPSPGQSRPAKAIASWYDCIILRTSWNLFENSDAINWFYCIMLWTSLDKFELLSKKSDAIVLLDRINSETSQPSQGQPSPQPIPNLPKTSPNPKTYPKRPKTSQNVPKRQPWCNSLFSLHHPLSKCQPRPALLKSSPAKPSQGQSRPAKAIASWYDCIILRTSWNLFENSDAINWFYCIMLWTSLNLAQPRPELACLSQHNTAKRPKTSKNVQKHPKTFQNVPERHILNKYKSFPIKSNVE